MLIGLRSSQVAASACVIQPFCSFVSRVNSGIRCCVRNEATASAVQVVPLAVRTFVRFNVMAIASSAITFRSERTIVYNFRVTDWHTYFVATNDNDAIWVHNADYAIVAPSVGGRGPWSLTSEGASREMRHDGFGRFSNQNPMGSGGQLITPGTENLRSKRSEEHTSELQSR